MKPANRHALVLTAAVAILAIAVTGTPQNEGGQPQPWYLDSHQDLGCANVKCTICFRCVDESCTLCPTGLPFELDEEPCFSIVRSSLAACQDYVASLNASALGGGYVNARKEYVHQVHDYSVFVEGSECSPAREDAVPPEVGGPQAPFVLELTRTFQSRSWQGQFPFGRHWKHNYDYALWIVEGATWIDAQIDFPSDSKWQFIDVGKDGTFQPKNDTVAAKATLEEQGASYLLTTKRGERFHFVTMPEGSPGLHRPDWIEDRNGFRLTFSYDTEADGIDRLETVADPYGRTLALEWGQLGLSHVVQKVVLPDGEAISYAYSTLDDYVVSYPNGDTSVYGHGFDSLGEFFAFNDAFGNPGSRKHRVYLTNARLVRGITDVEGNMLFVPRWIDAFTIRYEYSTGRRETYRFDQNGFPRSLTHDQSARTKSTAWGPVGFLPASRTNFLGETTVYGFDDSELTDITNPDGTRIRMGYAGALPVSLTNEAGLTTRYEYDTRGNLTATVFPDGSIQQQTYDGLGHVLSQVDENGNITRYEYDAYGNLNRKILPDGDGNSGNNPSWSFVHDVNGRRLSTTDPEGRTTARTYDRAGRLTRVTYPDGTTQDQVWGSGSGDPGDPIGTTGLVVASKDRNDDWTSFTYDGLDNLLSETDPLGALVVNQYVAGTTLLAREDREGDERWYTHDDAGRVIRQSVVVDSSIVLTTSFRHDALGRLVELVDPYGFRTSTSYDSRGRPTSVAREVLKGRFTPIVPTASPPVPLAAAAGRQISPAGLFATTVYGYDPTGREIARTDPEGNVWWKEYDERGRVVREIDPLGGVRVHTWDPAGNRVSTTDELGFVTHWTYTARNAVASSTDPLGNTIAYAYYDDDRVASVINAGTGGRRSFVYGCCGRLTSETTFVDGGSQDVTVTRVYDGNGNVIQRTDGEGSVWRWSYDARDRQLQSTDALGNVTLTSYIADASGYDARLASGQGRATITTDPLGNVTVRVFDGADRELRTVDPRGNASWQVYDCIRHGLVQEKRIDRNGGITLILRDGLGRTVEERDRLGNVTLLSHDLASHPTVIRDANGNVTRYAYDALGRRIEERYADGGLLLLSYYGNGRLRSRTDPKGNTTNYSYDPVGRPISVVYADLSEDRMTYDAGGRLVSAVSGLYGHTLTRSYDPADRLLQETQDGMSVRYGYDRRYLKTSLELPGGRHVDFGYGARGELVAVSSGGSPFVTYTRDALQRVLRKDLGNGTTTRYEYDERGWLTRVAHDSSGTDLHTLVYSYDAAGNRLARQDATFPEKSESYVLDAESRLTEWRLGTPGELPSREQTWDLDALSNWRRTVIDGATETRTHNEVNELVARGGTSLAHDANGNLVDDGIHLYEFDLSDRLTSVRLRADGSPIAEYSYDALGRRVQRIDHLGGQELRYVYDGLQVVEERDGLGNLVAESVYGVYLDEPIVRLGSGDASYYHCDGTFSPIVLTDAAGSVVERYQYDAYGRATSFDAAWSTPRASSRVGNPYAFTCRRLDPETGLMFYRARYYDPGLGRFLSRDPRGFHQGLNLYEYARSNPVLLVDPTGEAYTCLSAGVSATAFFPFVTSGGLTLGIDVSISHAVCVGTASGGPLTCKYCVVGSLSVIRGGGIGAAVGLNVGVTFNPDPTANGPTEGYSVSVSVAVGTPVASVDYNVQTGEISVSAGIVGLGATVYLGFKVTGSCTSCSGDRLTKVRDCASRVAANFQQTVNAFSLLTGTVGTPFSYRAVLAREPDALPHPRSWIGSSPEAG